MKKTTTGTKKTTLCYIGDLPDIRVDGITSSFAYNLAILKNHFHIVHSAEKASFTSNPIAKISMVITFWMRSFSFIRKHNPSIIYLNLPTSILGTYKILQLIKISDSIERKWVLHVHRGDFVKLIEKGTIYDSLIKKIHHKAHRIIVLSPTSESELNELYSSNKFKYLPNTVVPIHQNRKSTQRKNHFIFLSNYLASKGIFETLEVFTENRNFGELVCYGAIPDQGVESKLRAYENESIKINGPIYGDLKIEELKKAKCLILPSYSEGMPLVILEAMSCGLPVIASDVGYIREVVGDDYPYLISPQNKEALTEAIEKFIKDDNHQNLSESLLKRYQNLYKPELHNKKLVEIFNSLVDE